jgi:Ca2+/Na+ antiporter
MIFDLNFWFRVPSLKLESADFAIGYIFAALTILAIGFWIMKMFVKHEVKRKLLRKIVYLLFTIGITGLFWFAFRYENTPYFSTRYWVGVLVLIGLVWFVFLFKYLVFNYRREKKEYDEYELKRKYLPGR